MSPMLRRPQPEKLNVCKAFWFGNAHIARQEDLDSKTATKCMIENSSADLILDMAQTVNKSEVCWSKTAIQQLQIPSQALPVGTISQKWLFHQILANKPDVHHCIWHTVECSLWPASHLENEEDSSLYYYDIAMSMILFSMKNHHYTSHTRQTRFESQQHSAIKWIDITHPPLAPARRP